MTSRPENPRVTYRVDLNYAPDHLVTHVITDWPAWKAADLLRTLADRLDSGRHP